MNYAPNTTIWKPGAVVIHDCDSKSPKMLMRVVRWMPDGLVRTEYIHRDHPAMRDRSPNRPRYYDNDVKYLLDPARFGLSEGDDPWGPARREIQVAHEGQGSATTR